MLVITADTCQSLVTVYNCVEGWITWCFPNDLHKVIRRKLPNAHVEISRVTISQGASRE